MRKKKSQTLKRQANKKSSSNLNLTVVTTDGFAGEDVDMDLDLSTEIEVIKSHLEQLKRQVHNHHLLRQIWISNIS